LPSNISVRLTCWFRFFSSQNTKSRLWAEHSLFLISSSLPNLVNIDLFCILPLVFFSHLNHCNATQIGDILGIKTGSNLGRTEKSQTKRTRSALNRPGEELSKPLAYNWERDTEFAEVAGRITGGDRTMDSDDLMSIQRMAEK
jgi:hypothetical protein